MIHGVLPCLVLRRGRRLWAPTGGAGCGRRLWAPVRGYWLHRDRRDWRCRWSDSRRTVDGWAVVHRLYSRRFRWLGVPVRHSPASVHRGRGRRRGRRRRGRNTCRQTTAAARLPSAASNVARHRRGGPTLGGGGRRARL